MSTSTITWTLFGAKLKESLDIDTIQKQEKSKDNSELIGASDEDEYSVSDLVAEVFYVTRLRKIYSEDNYEENLKQLNRLDDLLVKFLINGKRILLRMKKKIKENEKLESNWFLEELIIKHYNVVKKSKYRINNEIYIIQEQIIENVEKNNKDNLKRIFEKINKELTLGVINYPLVTSIIFYLGKTYRKRYILYKKFNKFGKSNWSSLNKNKETRFITVALMGNNFATYFNYRIRNLIKTIQKIQQNICEYRFSNLKVLEKFMKTIEPYEIINKKYIVEKSCFALSEINGQEVIAFSGTFESNNSSILKIFPNKKEAKELENAISKLEKTLRFKSSLLVRTEINTKYYVNQSKHIMLNDILSINVSQSDFKKMKNIKRMFSCCEKKILSKYPSGIKKIYVKLEPCKLCVRAISANNNPIVIHGNPDNSTLINLESYDKLANDILDGKTINISDYFE